MKKVEGPDSHQAAGAGPSLPAMDSDAGAGYGGAWAMGTVNAAAGSIGAYKYIGTIFYFNKN